MTRERTSVFHSSACHDDSSGSDDDSSVQTAFWSKTPEQCMGLYPSIYIDAVFDHDVPTEFEELPDRYYGSGAY